MITLADVLTSSGRHPARPVIYPPEELWLQNAKVVAERVTSLLLAFGQSRRIVSGYRSPEDNVAAGGAKHSHHLTCSAVDLLDTESDLAEWCLSQRTLLERLGLWMEAPKYTPGWVHLQIWPPHSGARLFIP